MQLRVLLRFHLHHRLLDLPLAYNMVYANPKYTLMALFGMQIWLLQVNHQMSQKLCVIHSGNMQWMLSLKL